MTPPRRDGFAGLSVVPDHVETVDQVTAARAAACRESIVAFLHDMADRVEFGHDSSGRPCWVDQPMTAVLVLLGPEDASASWGGDRTLTTSDLHDAAQCILVASDGDQESIQERVAECRSWRVQERRNAAERQRQYEREHPFLCGCGKRCKSSAGLDAHKRTAHP